MTYRFPTAIWACRYRYVVFIAPPVWGSVFTGTIHYRNGKRSLTKLFITIHFFIKNTNSMPYMTTSLYDDMRRNGLAYNVPIHYHHPKEHDMPQLSYLDLIGRLTDLTRLATPPAPHERTGTFSSYDRRSRYNASTGRYEDWDANDDGTGVIRHEDGYAVVVEATSVIRRLGGFCRHGSHPNFHRRRSHAVVDMPLHRDFLRTSPRQPQSAPWHHQHLPQRTPTLSRGRNRFIPIPYHQTFLQNPHGTGLGLVLSFHLYQLRR
jgi:hypothetical protein